MTAKLVCFFPLAILSLVGILFAPVFPSQVTTLDIALSLLSLVLMATVLYLLIVHHRDQVEKERQARLAERDRNRSLLAEALREATAAVSSTLDRDEVLDRILDQVNHVIPGDTVNVMLVTGENARIVRWRGSGRFGDGDRLRSVTFPIADTPILRQMQETGAPIVIPDTFAYEGWVRVFDWVRSYVGAPIRVRGRVVGFLTVYSAVPGFFTPAHADLLRAFADRASVALENARLFREMSRRVEQLALLHRVGLALTSDLELREVLNSLYEQIDRIMDVGAFYVALYDRETGLIHFPLLTGVDGPQQIEPQDIHQRPGLTTYIIQTRQPLYVPDTQAVPSDAPYRVVALTESPTRSYLGVPLVAREQVIGVLSVQSYEPNAYADADAELLSTIASQAAIAIENARMYDEVRRRNRELALLNRVIAASAASLEIKPILEAVCQELALAFGLSQSVAAMLNEEKTRLVVAAEYRARGQESVLGGAISIADQPVVRHLLAHQAPLVVDDVRTDPRLASLHGWLDRRGIVSLLVLPLLVEGEVVGNLSLGTREFRPFASDEVELARRVAEQVSGALARARLEETRHRLSTAIEQAAESIMITNTDGTIVYVNPAFEQITGCSRTEAIGQTPRFLKSGRQGRAFYQRLWQTITSGQVWKGRLINRRQDGVPFTVDSTITPVRNQAGEIVHFVATMRDVTREVELEEQFRQSQKMEALGRLAGGIAHDFNNLLTVILISARLIERQLHPEDPLWEHVRRILETGERATKLNKQLLSFSRRQIVVPQVLNLNETVGDLSRMLQRIIGEDIELALSLAQDLWPVRMDPSQVDQVIMNLVVNARDAMPHGGSLTIETANVVLDRAYAARRVDVQAGEHVRLTVRDTGVGMDDEVKARLFEPFFTTKEPGQGTGLGLATVFGIVKQNGGHIQVESAVGRGTAFQIYLPRFQVSTLGRQAPGATPTPKPGVAKGDRTGAETVLVVEDEADVRELIVQILKAHGYRVLAANTGFQALGLSEQHPGPIHLLLTDVVMPGLSGREVAEQLRPQRPEMRVLYMSGYTGDKIAHHGVLAPGVAFLPKPLTPRSLTQKVRAVLDGHA